ncbi:adrenodoxin [Pyrenophora tritici-repentis]|nr:adrenodoxin [Pyrenophora tritici-repentis]
MAALMRFARMLRRSSIKQVFVLAFLLFHVFEIAQILHCLSNPTIDHVAPRPERVYIASLHWNNERILRSHWNDAVVALANALGRDNVFITVYESGSWDDSKGALKELDLALGAHNIRRNITLSPTTHLDEMSVSTRGQGWVDTPRGRKELRRIPYLSRLRNLTLEPLRQLVLRGERFDKILFLNDVVFDTNDVLRLLNTNGGDFAAACSLDFSRPPKFYDTFALRDAEGHEMLMQTWPYFRAKQSRRAILANRPVPVASCWNGMA